MPKRTVHVIFCQGIKMGICYSIILFLIRYKINQNFPPKGKKLYISKNSHKPKRKRLQTIQFGAENQPNS